MQGDRAVFIGIHDKRVVARKLGLRGIGKRGRPVLGHGLLDLETALSALGIREDDGLGALSQRT